MNNRERELIEAVSNYSEKHGLCYIVQSAPRQKYFSIRCEGSDPSLTGEISTRDGSLRFGFCSRSFMEYIVQQEINLD